VNKLQYIAWLNDFARRNRNIRDLQLLLGTDFYVSPSVFWHLFELSEHASRRNLSNRDVQSVRDLADMFKQLSLMMLAALGDES